MSGYVNKGRLDFYPQTIVGNGFISRLYIYHVSIYTAQISKTKCDLLKLLFNVSAKLFAEKTILCNFLCAGFRIKNQSGQSTMTLTMMRMMMVQMRLMMMTPWMKMIKMNGWDRCSPDNELRSKSAGSSADEWKARSLGSSQIGGTWISNLLLCSPDQRFPTGCILFPELQSTDGSVYG